ncbi:hypothetical protein LGM65_04745 [Burkholderia anthina]|uniref:group II intron maturase-specific domain-containing protein n=1 Tax=Burkholderia anthina TaxID=179879 RepID=UPI001CF2F89A|nr:group II intron maturase-specific domain-containing protein [Burkholderia anthina]MCA8090199.1 hypothetical protein [Burkholderia anthina]
MTQEPERNSGDGARGAEAGTAATGRTKAEGPSLMEAVVERSNLWLAYRRVKAFLEKGLKLRINEAKSTCARPWTRKFLGCSVTMHRQARLRIAPESLKRLTARVGERMRPGRRRSVLQTIEALNPVLRGWISYYRHTEVKGALDELDGWVRRRMRSLLWRQAKRRGARGIMLRGRGLTEARAWQSSRNGRGPWWNAGASHMNAAFPKRDFDALGLVSLPDAQQCLQRS